MADRIIILVRMGHFSCTDGTSVDGPWSIQAVRMADRSSYKYVLVIFHVLMGPLWTVHGPLS